MGDKGLLEASLAPDHLYSHLLQPPYANLPHRLTQLTQLSLPKHLYSDSFVWRIIEHTNSSYSLINRLLNLTLFPS